MRSAEMSLLLRTTHPYPQPPHHAPARALGKLRLRLAQANLELRLGGAEGDRRAPLAVTRVDADACSRSRALWRSSGPQALANSALDRSASAAAACACSARSRASSTRELSASIASRAAPSSCSRRAASAATASRSATSSCSRRAASAEIASRASVSSCSRRAATLTAASRAASTAAICACASRTRAPRAPPVRRRGGRRLVRGRARVIQRLLALVCLTIERSQALRQLHSRPLGFGRGRLGLCRACLSRLMLLERSCQLGLRRSLGLVQRARVRATLSVSPLGLGPRLELLASLELRRVGLGAARSSSAGHPRSVDRQVPALPGPAASRRP